MSTDSAGHFLIAWRWAGSCVLIFFLLELFKCIFILGIYLHTGREYT